MDSGMFFVGGNVEYKSISVDKCHTKEWIKKVTHTWNYCFENSHDLKRYKENPS